VGFFYALITLRLELLGGLTNGGCTCNQGAKPAQLIMERLVVGYTELRPTTVCQGTGLVWDRERWERNGPRMDRGGRLAGVSVWFYDVLMIWMIFDQP
jgi:hypothetical protein